MLRTRFVRPYLSLRLLTLPRATVFRQNHSNAQALRLARDFPSTGFERIDQALLVEEEKLPYYRCEDYCPIRIGQVIQGSYQVVAKLGYGTTSTVWLSRDLR